jgi:hypothetical protein
MAPSIAGLAAARGSDHKTCGDWSWDGGAKPRIETEGQAGGEEVAEIEMATADFVVILQLAIKAQGFQIDNDALHNVLMSIEETAEMAVARIDAEAKKWAGAYV